MQTLRPHRTLLTQHLQLDKISVHGASVVAQTAKSAWNAGDPGLFPGWERSPGEGNGNPRQYSCLESSMDRGVHGIAESRTRLSDFTFTTNSYVPLDKLFTFL